MKKFLPALILLFCSTPAFAWNCPQGQHRVQAPPGTPTTAPFYDVVEGIAFVCESDKPNDPKTPGQQQNQNQSQTSNNTNTNSSNSQSSSNASASSKSASVSSSTSSSGVTNSGNSSSTANNNSSGNVTSFTENQARQTPMAYAPDAAFTTSPCVKGFSGGVSLPGMGGTGGFSKTDKGCDTRQTAVVFHALGNDTAAAKLLCSTDASKRAKLTLVDCLALVAPRPQTIVVPAPPQASPPQIIVVPASSQPVPATIEAPAARLTDLGSFRVLRSTSSGTCPTVRVALGSKGIAILDKAVAFGDGEIILSGNVYTSGVAVSYLRKRTRAKISIKALDEQGSDVAVQFWSQK